MELLSDKYAGTFVTQKGNEKPAVVVGTPGITAVNPAAVDGNTKVTQSSLLAQKEKDVEFTEKQLDLKKKEYHERMQKCKTEESNLFARQETLQASVLKFDKFVKDNDQKRQKALRIAKDEAELRQSKIEEIVRLRAQLAELEEKRDHSATLLMRDEQYLKYFTRVCEYDKTSDWQSNEAVINRYETLKAANSGLYQKSVENDRHIEKLRKELAEFTKQRTNEILNLTNQLAQAQTRLDTVTRDSAELDFARSDADGNDKNTTRLLGQIKMAVLNLHQRARPQANVSHKNVNLIALLDDIQIRIGDLMSITNTIDSARGSQPASARIPVPPPPRAAAAQDSGDLQGRITFEMQRPPKQTYESTKSAAYDSSAKGAMHLGTQPGLA